MAKPFLRSTVGGFTLIEVMTVVVVIGILVAIAVPNYQEHVLRAKLVDAGSSLSQLRVGLEQYYQDNRRYDDPTGAAGNCGGAAVSGSDNKYFSYTCSTSDEGQGFTVTATGNASGGTSAFVYTIDHGNNRTTTALPSGWGETPAKCWITAKGQACK